MPANIAIAFLAVATIARAAPQSACEEFSRGVSFRSGQAVGTWHLLRLRNQYADSTDAQCVQFSPVTDQERKTLSDQIAKYVDVKWEKLALKMQIPCVESGPLGRNRDYFLERLDADGSYQTLQMPPPNVKLESADYNRHPMRLKLVEGKYLAMLDCREQFMFLLDREPQKKELQPALKKLLEDYLPDDH